MTPTSPPILTLTSSITRKSSVAVSISSTSMMMLGCFTRRRIDTSFSIRCSCQVKETEKDMKTTEPCARPPKPGAQYITVFMSLGTGSHTCLLSSPRGRKATSGSRPHRNWLLSMPRRARGNRTDLQCTSLLEAVTVKMCPHSTVPSVRQEGQSHLLTSAFHENTTTLRLKRSLHSQAKFLYPETN